MSSTGIGQGRQAVTGALFAFTAAIGYSVKAIFIKLGYAKGVDAMTLLALRMMFALPFFAAMALWSLRRHAAGLAGRDALAVFVLGLCGFYLASVLDFQGLVYISASLERLILFLYPTFVVLASAVLYRRAVSRATWTALVLCYLGIALVLGRDVGTGQQGIVIGAALVFASAVSYTIYLIGTGALVARVGSVRLAAYASTVACFAVIAHFGVTHTLGDLVQPAPVYGYALAMALVSTVLPVVLLSAAIRRIGAGPTAVIGSVGPVATLALAWAFLGETLTAGQWIGAALVVGGAVRISVDTKAAQARPAR